MIVRGAIGSLAALAAVIALTAGPGPAAAQPTVQPDGSLSNPAAAPAQPAPAAQPRQPVIIQQGPDGKTTVVGGEQDTGPERYFYTDPDTGIERTTQNWDVKLHGPVPEHHVVRKGDTLWDLSWLYFNDPWEWPKVWSYNPSITSPHWIYPGDLIRLYPKGEAPVVIQPVGDPDDVVDVVSPIRNVSYGVELRQLAYVDEEKLEFAGKIVGAVDEKTLLSLGDHVYISYPEGKPPKVGGRYAVYTETQAVKHPDGKGKVGSYVRILGEVRVLSVKKDKRARAIIEEANDVIERGHNVGPVKRSYRGDKIQPTPNARDLTGTVLAMLKSDQIIGEGQLVFIDLGKNQGVKVGNTLHVVRRGDAYDPKMGQSGKVGQNDPDYPSRSIGRILIVDLGKNASAGIVLESSQEFEPGDRVLMQQSK